jgi:phage terminase large subunit GpA-like protein
MLPTESADAIRASLARSFDLFRCPAPTSLSDWAEEHFRLPAEASHTTGGWSAYPFQRGMLDAMADDDIAECTFRKSKRVGFTKALLAMIAYSLAHRRRKVVLWQPTDDDRDAFVKTEVDPLIRDMPALRAVALTGHADTLRQKLFVGGAVLHLLGGKAARAYRRITVSVALLDELDGFDETIERSADPITLARGRLEGAPFPKLIAGSTPRIKGISLVEAREQHADAKMTFHIACLHCGVEHPLLWGAKDVEHGFKWDEHDPDSVRHVCPHCHGSITQADYLQAWHDGAWVSECGGYRFEREWLDANGHPRRPPRHVAFHVWAAYSPQRTWSSIVSEFLQATARAKTGDVGPLRGFVNESLAETWEETFERVAEHELAQRAEDYKLRTVPVGGLVLVAGVDVQDDRFEVVVWAFGRGEESWVVDYAVIYCNPSAEREWLKLDEYLAGDFHHASGRVVKIEATAVDTGGHHTHMVYSYARTRRRVYAIKGENTVGRPINGRSTAVDVNFRGQLLKRGAKLWHVGVDTAKDLLHGRLQVKQPGPGYVHFSKDLPDGFYEQLLAEKRQRVRTSRGIELRWVKPNGARNEALDCTVYALFAAHVLGVHTATETTWRRREQQFHVDAPVPRTAPPAPTHPAQQQPPTQKPRSRGRRVVGHIGGSRW